MAKRSRIMYIEYKGDGLVGPARIGRVTYSKTGSTLHYGGKAFQSLKGSGFKANYFDVATHGGHRIPEAVLERDYCLAWFLVGLSQSRLGQILIFKGGTALKRCHFGDYRFSEDLDFSLARPAEFAEIREGLEEVFERVAQASGIRFDFEREDRQSHVNSYTFYLSYQGPLPNRNSVKVDITISDESSVALKESVL
jgi:predicted nucleotidyltransferase component of viral defense system